MLSREGKFNGVVMNLSNSYKVSVLSLGFERGILWWNW